MRMDERERVESTYGLSLETFEAWKARSSELTRLIAEQCIAEYQGQSEEPDLGMLMDEDTIRALFKELDAGDATQAWWDVLEAWGRMCEQEEMDNQRKRLDERMAAVKGTKFCFEEGFMTKEELVEELDEIMSGARDYDVRLREARKKLDLGQITEVQFADMREIILGP